MSDNQETDPRAKNLAEAAARLVRDGVADNQAAFDHVVNESAGRDLARRINAQRGQGQQEKK